ncbi:hypothetical protein [Streptomyces puniciscabiei]|uniref:hypothetical protein n=1 Tax=Streptomyces puniciscabiei TaxID=164348 RepID=UPI000AB86AE4|nr:hypothetical protein [Streptomyces puniciscabiei]
MIRGAHDTSAPLDLTGRRTAAPAPDATLKVDEGAGHGLSATHAGQLTTDPRDFAATG